MINDAIETFKDRVRVAVAADPSIWPKTRLYFFGAGHGIAPQARDAALLAADARPDRYTRHVSCSSLLDFFSLVQRFRELALFADCCRTSVVGAVNRMPADWTDDPEDRGGVRKFFACGSIFSKRAQEETHLPLDERRGYFSRALLDGLRTGPPGEVGAPITSTWLKDYIAEHMRRASTGRFRRPLEPDFVDEGAGDVIFGQASLPNPKYLVTIQVSSIPVTGLQITTLAAGSIPLNGVRSAANPNVFEFQLEAGLYLAIPQGPGPGHEWTVIVKEGGVNLVF
jgi:hypothetical protein